MTEEAGNEFERSRGLTQTLYSAAILLTNTTVARSVFTPLSPKCLVYVYTDLFGKLKPEDSSGSLTHTIPHPQYFFQNIWRFLENGYDRSLFEALCSDVSEA
jgi:hypothetical protein